MNVSDRRKCELVGCELETGRGCEVADACGARGPGDRDDGGREREFPGVRDAVDVGACLVGGLLDRAVAFCVTLRVSDTTERAPGQDGEAELGAVLEFFPAGAEAGENWS